VPAIHCDDSGPPLAGQDHDGSFLSSAHREVSIDGVDLQILKGQVMARGVRLAERGNASSAEVRE
jgi:hypothetical protein